MRSGQNKSYLSDPLCVSSKSVDTGSCRQGPDFYSEVCWTADQGVQLIIVVYAEYCNNSKTVFYAYAMSCWHYITLKVSSDKT